MEASIVNFCKDLYLGDENSRGTVTSGGTESIILSCKAHRDLYKNTKGITKPEVIAPVSVHVAFDKACHYLGIKLVKVSVNDEGIPNIYDFRSKILEKSKQDNSRWDYAFFKKYRFVFTKTMARIFFKS